VRGHAKAPLSYRKNEAERPRANEFNGIIFNPLVTITADLRGKRSLLEAVVLDDDVESRSALAALVG